PKYGKQLGGIKAYLSSVDGNAAMDTLKAEGALKFDVDGTEVSLSEEDLLIDIAQKEGYVTEADNVVTVVLDANLTPELIEEGFVYEIISKIQTMRKDSGFEVMDHIKVSFNGNDKIAEIALKNTDTIATKVLANEMVKETKLSNMKEWNVNGENVTIGVERV
ncbi:MAG: isoleucine--tRNA ligase, partial [Lachnospiraceae bacterium]|nr:isoleucine--tRNA ligase [Lachnospiraceae bacterium]